MGILRKMAEGSLKKKFVIKKCYGEVIARTHFYRNVKEIECTERNVIRKANYHIRQLLSRKNKDFLAVIIDIKSNERGTS